MPTPVNPVSGSLNIPAPTQGVDWHAMATGIQLRQQALENQQRNDLAQQQMVLNQRNTEVQEGRNKIQEERADNYEKRYADQADLAQRQQDIALEQNAVKLGIDPKDLPVNNGGVAGPSYTRAMQRHQEINDAQQQSQILDTQLKAQVLQTSLAEHNQNLQDRKSAAEKREAMAKLWTSGEGRNLMGVNTWRETIMKRPEGQDVGNALARASSFEQSRQAVGALVGNDPEAMAAVLQQTGSKDDDLAAINSIQIPVEQTISSIKERSVKQEDGTFKTEQFLDVARTKKNYSLGEATALLHNIDTIQVDPYVQKQGAAAVQTEKLRIASSFVTAILGSNFDAGMNHLATSLGSVEKAQSMVAMLAGLNHWTGPQFQSLVDKDNLPKQITRLLAIENPQSRLVTARSIQSNQTEATAQLMFQGAQIGAQFKAAASSPVAGAQTSATGPNDPLNLHPDTKMVGPDSMVMLDDILNNKPGGYASMIRAVEDQKSLPAFKTMLRAPATKAEDPVDTLLYSHFLGAIYNKTAKMPMPQGSLDPMAFNASMANATRVGFELAHARYDVVMARLAQTDPAFKDNDTAVGVLTGRIQFDPKDLQTAQLMDEAKMARKQMAVSSSIIGHQSSTAGKEADLIGANETFDASLGLGAGYGLIGVGAAVTAPLWAAAGVFSLPILAALTAGGGAMTRGGEEGSVRASGLNTVASVVAGGVSLSPTRVLSGAKWTLAKLFGRSIEKISASGAKIEVGLGSKMTMADLFRFKAAQGEKVGETVQKFTAGSPVNAAGLKNAVRFEGSGTPTYEELISKFGLE